MKTLGISKIGMNGSVYYQYLLNHIIKPKENFKVETVDFNKDYDYILFDGGSDVTPKLYGENNVASFINEIRDLHEVKIFEQYVNNDKTKFIGICRGSQFLNVMFGGTLYQDLGTEKMQHNPFHEIEVSKEVKEEFSLRHILPETLIVNSTHHQAVKCLGYELLINSWDTTFHVVESYTHINDKVRATQFHPEFFNDFPYTIPILKWLFRDN